MILFLWAAGAFWVVCSVGLSVLCWRQAVELDKIKKLLGAAVSREKQYLKQLGLSASFYEKPPLPRNEEGQFPLVPDLESEAADLF